VVQTYGVDLSNVSGAVREVRPLLAAGCFAARDRPGLQLPTQEDAFACVEAQRTALRIDGTEVRSARARVAPAARRSSPAETTAKGRVLFSGVLQPGRVHDQTAFTPRASLNSSTGTR
jgi:hypothetical protein